MSIQEHTVAALVAAVRNVLPLWVMGSGWFLVLQLGCCGPWFLVKMKGFNVHCVLQCFHLVNCGVCNCIKIKLHIYVYIHKYNGFLFSVLCYFHNVKMLSNSDLYWASTHTFVAAAKYWLFFLYSFYFLNTQPWHEILPAYCQMWIRVNKKVLVTLCSFLSSCGCFA